MFNVIIDLISWFLNSVLKAVTFPVIDLVETWNTLKTVLYYPVKILGEFNIKAFFTILNIDWALTLTLGLIKGILKFIRGK